MKRLALLLAAAFATSGGAWPAVTVGGHVVCLEEGDFDAIRQSPDARRRAVVQHLMDADRCFVPGAGIRAYIIDHEWIGATKARVYASDGGPIIVYGQGAAFRDAPR